MTAQLDTTTAQPEAPSAPRRAAAAPRQQTLGVDDIARLLPHRFPFALLDRVVALEPGVSAEAVKNVSASDPVLAGHFPGRMIFPGVLLAECIAQLAAVIYGSAAAQQTGQPVGDIANRVGYLAEIKQAKFLRAVVPGDQVMLRAQSGPRRGPLISVSGQASVGPDIAATVRLTVTERESESG